MPLPIETIDRIWAKLSVSYGHRFLSIWDGSPDDVVKADWANTLDGMREDRILWALQNLPARAPDAPTFRALCLSMPEPREQFPALPDGPKAPVPPAIAQAMAKLREEREDEPKEPGRVRWARRYIERWGAPGACPTAFERDVLRHAKRIVERFETPAADLLPERKAEAQAMVDAYQEAAP